MKYQIQGRSANGNDWSTEYVADSDENATVETMDEAEQMITELLAEYPESTADEYRIVEIEN